MRRLLLLCLLGMSMLGHAQISLPASPYKDYLIMRNGLRIDCSLAEWNFRSHSGKQLTYYRTEGSRRISLDSLSEIGKGKSLVYRRLQVHGVPAGQEAWAAQVPRDWQWLQVLEGGAAATLYAPAKGGSRYYYQRADGPVYELMPRRIPRRYRRERSAEVGMFDRHYQVQLWDQLRYPGQRPKLVARTAFAVQDLRAQVVAYNLHADSTYLPPLRMPQRSHRFRLEGHMGLGIATDLNHDLVYVGLRRLTLSKKRPSYSALTELWFMRHKSVEVGFSVGVRYEIGTRGWWVASSLGPAFHPMPNPNMDPDIPGLGFEPAVSGMLEGGYGLKRWTVSLQSLNIFSRQAHSYLLLHAGYRLY